MNKDSVKDQVFSLMQQKEWVSVEDFEQIFPAKTEGHQSWPQRMRDLRIEGYRIIKRKKANCLHTWEYHLIMPQPIPSPEPVFLERKKQYAWIG